MSFEALCVLLGAGLLYAAGFLYHLESKARSGLMIPCHQHPPGKYSRAALGVLVAGILLLVFGALPFFRMLWPILWEVFLR